MNRSTQLQIISTLAGVFFAGSLHAQAVPATAPQSLNDLECRTLLKLSGDERDFTLIYLHGFVSGKSSQFQLPFMEMAKVTDRLVDSCIDRPADKVLGVLEQLRKTSR